jgi:hypothetical protein
MPPTAMVATTHQVSGHARYLRTSQTTMIRASRRSAIGEKIQLQNSMKSTQSWCWVAKSWKESVTAASNACNFGLSPMISTASRANGTSRTRLSTDASPSRRPSERSSVEFIQCSYPADAPRKPPTPNPRDLGLVVGGRPDVPRAGPPRWCASGTFQ